MTSHGNDKEYAPFSRMYLELATMQKHIDTVGCNTTQHTHENTHVPKLEIFLN